MTTPTATARIEPGPRSAARRGPGRLRALWLAGAAVLALAAAMASLRLGSRGVSWSEVWRALGGADATLGEAAVTKRIPRTVLALVAGAALGVSGAVMQGVTRNPLADPGVLGLNMGAALAVAIGIAHFGLVRPGSYIWLSIAGAGTAAAFVHAVASLGRGGPTPLALALAGAATSAAATSFTTAVVLPRNDISDTFQSWLVGGVGGGTFAKIGTIAPFVAVGLAISLLSARGLNSLALGDELAAGLGEKVALTRAVAALGSVVLCGAATAACGPIGFVGLVVPHACRLAAGPDHRWVIPLSAMSGATLVTVSDTIGRLVARPAEIDVGIVTAVVGAPVFIAIVRRHKVREL